MPGGNAEWTEPGAMKNAAWDFGNDGGGSAGGMGDLSELSGSNDLGALLASKASNDSLANGGGPKSGGPRKSLGGLTRDEQWKGSTQEKLAMLAQKYGANIGGGNNQGSSVFAGVGSSANLSMDLDTLMASSNSRGNLSGMTSGRTSRRGSMLANAAASASMAKTPSNQNMNSSMYSSDTFDASFNVDGTTTRMAPTGMLSNSAFLGGPTTSHLVPSAAARAEAAEAAAAAAAAEAEKNAPAPPQKNAAAARLGNMLLGKGMGLKMGAGGSSGGSGGMGRRGGAGSMGRLNPFLKGSKSTSTLNQSSMKPKTRKLRVDTLKSLDLGITPKSRMKSTNHRQSPGLPLKSSFKSAGSLRRADTMSCMREIEVVLPGDVTIKRQSSITFNESVKVKRVTSSSSLADNPKKLWYQNDEFKEIKRKSYQLAKQADKMPGMEKIYCTRGLERLMPSNREGVMKTKYETWDAVLDEQDNQRLDGKYDDEQLAKMYRCLSNKSLQEAADRAQQDASAIQRYLQNTA